MSEKKLKSLAPIDKTMPIALTRLMTLDRKRRHKDPEWIMMRLWEKENIRCDFLDMGKVPLDDPCHICNDRCTAQRHWYEKIPNEERARVAAAMLQWLASNVGRSFYAKFLGIVEERNKVKNPRRRRKINPWIHLPSPPPPPSCARGTFFYLPTFLSTPPSIPAMICCMMS